MTERGALLGGRYELDQVIGRGGMAEVWRAHDTRLNRDVAVKRLRVDLASDPTFQARFRREAQSAAGLNHPHIVAVYDTGEERDTKSDVMVPYIVMELVEGITLREVLRDGRKILPARALEFAAGVLDALAYSHRAGIIHRDIKPANVMLTPQGTVKVMDFGIARAVADTSATMTQTAAVIGTAQYLSPEQARGEKVDNRSDIYSVGCLLYELLVGEPPFKGDSPVSVAYQHVREAPIPPSRRDPEITPEMDAITLKALAKDPRDRYQDASEFRDDIGAALGGRPVLAMRPATTATAATQVIASDPLTTTARRAAVPTEVVPAMKEVDEEDEEDAPKRTGLKVTLTLLSILLLGALGTVLYFVFFSPPPGMDQVAVPDVVGFTEEAAVEAIEDRQLVADVQGAPSADVAVGLVISTDPVGGEAVDVNSSVTVSVSTGPGTIKIPDNLVGMTQAEAESALRALNLVPKAEPEASDTVEEGRVISTDPTAGQEVDPGSEVVLKVSSGPEDVPVPDGLEGLTFSEAERALTDVGLVAVRNDEPSDDVASGTVIRTSPGAGESAGPRGSTVDVFVSSGQQLVPVPDLRGSTEEQARAALKKIGLQLRAFERENANQPAGLIFSQLPNAGQSVEPGSEVEVNIAVAPATEDPETPPDGEGEGEGEGEGG